MFIVQATGEVFVRSSKLGGWQKHYFTKVRDTFVSPRLL
jgi:hypothetical protein